MSRPPNIQRPVAMNLHLPEDIRTRLDLFLFSTVEGRVPKGAYQAFFIERINEFFARNEATDAKPNS
jgi:hypothetical protein